MTQLPNHLPHGQPNPLAPGREILRVQTKRLANGRLIEFVWVLNTFAGPDMIYKTWQLSRAPTLDCPCLPQDLDDVMCCAACEALVCARRHSRSCQSCGKVFCSACLEGIHVRGVRAIVCKDCAKKLCSSTTMKVLRGVKKTLWG